MTNSLKKVIERLGELPEKKQNAIAKLIADELKWEKSYASSSDQLLSLAEEAIIEYKKGKTRPLNMK